MWYVIGVKTLQKARWGFVHSKIAQIIHLQISMPNESCDSLQLTTFQGPELWTQLKIQETLNYGIRFMRIAKMIMDIREWIIWAIFNCTKLHYPFCNILTLRGLFMGTAKMVFHHLLTFVQCTLREEVILTFQLSCSLLVVKSKSLFVAEDQTVPRPRPAFQWLHAAIQYFHCWSVDSIIYVAVPCRNWRLFHRLFWLHRCIESVVPLNFC